MKRLLAIIVMNIIFLMSWIVVGCLIPFPYSLILIVFLFCIYYIIDFILFGRYIAQFSLNDYEEYHIPLKRLFTIKSIIIEKNGSIFTAIVGADKLIFNLKYCIFPLMYIRAYFIRQFLFKYFEVNKIPPEKLDHNYQVLDDWYDLTLEYGRKKFFLLKGGRTRQNYIIKIINVINFTKIGRRLPGTIRYYKISERDFVNDKNPTGSLRKALKNQNR